MTPQQFTWFLKGALTGKKTVSEADLKTIKTQLATVFRDHIDPSYPAHQQQALHQAHQGKASPNVKLRC